MSHRWVPSHYDSDGTVMRQCSACRARRVERPGREPYYLLLSGEALDAEPGCSGPPKPPRIDPTRMF